MARRIAIGLGALVLLGVAGGAVLLRVLQSEWFLAREVRRLEARSRAHAPEPGGIVFTGSSSIRLWSSLGEDLAPLPVSNQGFGGSHIAHVSRYAPRIVLPHRPRMVVLYAGDNDLAGGDKTPESVAADFGAFAETVHAELPEARIYFVSIKPSILRRARWPAMRRANELIAAACARDERLVFLDVATAMLGEDGAPRPELFRWDRLHLNDEGYALWTSILRPRLERDWRLRRGEP
jgi:lysophospholipase L1-like esterase